MSMSRKIWMVFLFVLGNSLLLLSQNCHVGDIITNPDGSKGVVFWVNQNHTEGWMVAMEDASESVRWGSQTLIDMPFTTTSNDAFRFDLLMPELDGKENTRKIREKAQTTSGWPSNYAAGEVDYDNGWYLPSIGQLRILFGNLPLIEQKLASNDEFVTLSDAKKYWSSTQNGKNSAWAVNGGACYITSNQKNNYNAVRAIRNFEMTGGFATYHWSPTNDVVADIQVHPDETTAYTVTVSMGNSCSAEDTQVITVSHADDTVIAVTECGSYTWEGIVYTSSGDYTRTLTTAEGCEYTATLHLTIIEDMTVTIDVGDEEICEGESTTLHAEVSPVTFYAPGDILCTDGSVVKPANWPCGKMAKGIVFYVDASGRHGWAVKLTATGNIRWASKNQYAKHDIPGLYNYEQWKEAIKDFNGYSNTQVIDDYSHNSTQPTSSFPILDGLGFENGWYIPAIGQLNVLFGAIPTVNASLGLSGVGGTPIGAEERLWSSTEFASSSTYKHAMIIELISNDSYYTGRINHVEKIEYIRLRAVIDF